MQKKFVLIAASAAIFVSCASVSAKPPSTILSRIPDNEFKSFDIKHIAQQTFVVPVEFPSTVPSVRPQEPQRQAIPVKVVVRHTPKKIPVLSHSSGRAYALIVLGSVQYSCINRIFEKESGWKTFAHNSSGAYGIPQALPGSKMAVFGSDWRTNPVTQVKWGIHYVNGRYGSACAAWGFWSNHHWY